MRTELQELQADLDVTTVYVTHDQTEAMAMGDRIAVMDGGVLQQVGPPEEVYRSPVNQFVADFIGSPSINLLSADVEGETLRAPAGLRTNSTTRNRSQATTASALASARRTSLSSIQARTRPM